MRPAFLGKPDYARINPAYFDQADARMAGLVQAGLVPCIVGSWGYYLPIMGIRRSSSTGVI